MGADRAGTPTRGAGIRRSPWLPVLALVAGCARPLERPDVWLVSLDTVRADFLTFLDAETAPNLTALARRGTVFTAAMAGSSWTLPSHAQLFTGQPPTVHGVQGDDWRIDPATTTLPECLARAGYATAGVWSGWYLAGAYGFGRGFQRYRCALAPDPEADRALAAALERGGPAAYWAASLRASESHAAVTAPRVRALALEVLAEAFGPDASPVFLFTHFFDPHYDYVPPPPFDSRFDPDYRGALDGRDYWRNPAVWDPRVDPPRRIGERDLEHVRALYRGEIASCDRELGELLADLERRGRLARTLIVVTSDHGEEFFEHGNRGHRQTLYDDVLRVPLLVVPPEGSPAVRACDALVGLDDVLPTVLDYAGVRTPASVFGRSLRPAIEGGVLPPRPVLASLAMVRGGPGAEVPLVLEALVEPDADGGVAGKLVRRVRLEPGGGAVVEAVERFDLAADPLERDAGATPAELADAWERMERAETRLRNFHAELARTPEAARTTDARAVFAPELEALGYADLPTPQGEAGGSAASGPLPPLALPADVGPPKR